jgi:hypothetical protein
LDFDPQHRFYRVIARDGEALSVPSPMERIGREFNQGLPSASVLQTRSTQATGIDGNPKEDYIATEMNLPPK